MKTNGRNGGKKVKGWGVSVTGGGGMKKHARSGVSHNHALSIARTREHNKQLDEDARLREKRKGNMFNSVRELLKKNKVNL